MPETTRSNLQPHELSKMIIGDDDVDVSRWKQLCSGDYAGDEVVAWFWEHMESCSAAERLCVLQWTTGYSRLPDDTSDKYDSGIVVWHVPRGVTICDNLCMYNIRRDRDPAHRDKHLPSTSTCDGLGQLVLPT